MKVSIIVVAHQRYNQIQCLLYSLMSQTYSNFEVIVLHDGVDDEHFRIMTNFLSDNRFRYDQTLMRYNDWGMSLRNIGLDMIIGDIVVNTNDDNYYTPNWLEEVVSAFKMNSETNFVYYDMILSHNNIENHNKKDYGLFIPQLKHSYIDMGQFAVKAEIIKDHKFHSIAPADGVLVEEMLPKLKPHYINKVLFVHN
jgi:glycosyltransferase involved in cell wall biosynthesis